MKDAPHNVRKIHTITDAMMFMVDIYERSLQCFGIELFLSEDRQVCAF